MQTNQTNHNIKAEYTVKVMTIFIHIYALFVGTTSRGDYCPHTRKTTQKIQLSSSETFGQILLHDQPSHMEE